MAANRLKEFFREKKAKAGPGDIDWQARKDAWVKAIGELYKTIREEYLAAAVADGMVKISVESKEIMEDYIGRYKVPVLVLQVGQEKAQFFPKGTNIVGATGRIDLVGDMGEVTIVQQVSDRWAVVASRTPTLKIIPLDEESLLEALKSVMRR
jgi:hypothetical protein